MSYEGRIVYTGRREGSKKRHPRRKVFIPLLFLISALVFIGGLIYLLRLPEFQIREIKISGIKTLNEESVRAVINRQLEGRIFLLIPRSSFLFVRSSALSAEIAAAFPRIKEVKIEKNLPDAITVTIKEREFWGILCNDLKAVEVERSDKKNEEILDEAKEVAVSVCVYVDKDGFSYEYAPSSSGSLITKIKTDYPEIEIGRTVFDGKIVERMHFLHEEIKRAIGADAVVYEFSLKIPSEIRVLTSDGFKIYFNVEDNFQNVFRVLKAVLEEEINPVRSKSPLATAVPLSAERTSNGVKAKKYELEYIDLRFGNKVFYKLR